MKLQSNKRTIVLTSIPSNHIIRKAVYIIPTNIGNYSMYVENDLTNIRLLDIFVYKNSVITPKDIVATPSGSILYFDKNIGEIFSAGDVYICDAFFEYELGRWMDEIGNLQRIESFGDLNTR